jgi:hypothetical protein
MESNQVSGIEVEPKVYHNLRHPLHPDVRLSARVMDGWHENGRFVGLVVQFTDGHTVSMTFEEIREAQE